MMWAMVLAIFCDILSAMGLHCRPFHPELHCNPPLCGYPPPPTLHPYISACGVDKKQSKMAGKQLAVDCAVGNLIAIK